ncbi:MAG: hypothetical protein ACR2PA_05755 [Hyphomicrobiaceae bacterium]
MWPGRRRAQQHTTIHPAGEVHAHHRGGMFATIISAFALVFSGFSFYESVLKAPRLSIYVPPQIAYTDPDRPDSPFEVFVLPLTLANDGARTGTVLSVELTVANPRTGNSKQFYASHFGPWGTNPVKPFTPISLSGRDSFSSAIQFFPRIGETVPRVMDLEPGDYTLDVRVNIVAAGKSEWFPHRPTESLTFRMQAGKMDYRNFGGNRTMELWSPDYQPASTGN